jgi:hypothetical protein
VDIGTRVKASDWASASTHLDGYGWVMFKKLLTADECETIVGLSADNRHFRTHVVMARHGFGGRVSPPQGRFSGRLTSSRNVEPSAWYLRLSEANETRRPSRRRSVASKS